MPRRADPLLLSENMQRRAESGPADVQGRARLRITWRDVVQDDHISGILRIGTQLFPRDLRFNRTNAALHMLDQSNEVVLDRAEPADSVLSRPQVVTVRRIQHT
jgi:hypothetical protein